jgi:F-type H+-transporting ATPase subunit b
VNINLTLLAQLISFAIFVWVCKKYIWPPVVEAMQERQKQIADGLNAAEKAEADLEAAKAEIGQQIAEAKTQAAGIIEQANKRASQIIEEAKDAANAEGTRLKEAAQADIEQEVNRAKEQLRTQVAALALAGAQKILEASIDENAHKAVVDRLAAGL